MEKEIEAIKAKLKHTTTKVPIGVKGADLTDEENFEIFEKFFDSGAQNWYYPYVDITFPTIFVKLSREEAQAIIKQHNLYEKNPKEYKLEEKSGLESLLKTLNMEFEQSQWKKAFVKLSTRSPKDSIKILQRGLKSLEVSILEGIEKETLVNEAKKSFSCKDFNYKISSFAQSVQDNFYVSDGISALEVLISSDRVLEDLEYAFSFEPKIPYEKAGINILLREWIQAIPIFQEFRGFVWNGSINAIGQYYHSLCLPGLFEKKDEIKAKLKEFFMGKIQPKLNENLKCCIVDFAILDKNTIKLIEINPFDGKALASLRGSTGLFDLDDPIDMNFIQKGPLELRIREKPLSDADIKVKLNITWKEALKEYL